MINNLWLVHEWYAHMLCLMNYSHVQYAMLVCTSTPFSCIRDDISNNQSINLSINQSSKKTDFTVDLLWWGLLRLAQIQ